VIFNLNTPVNRRSNLAPLIRAAGRRLGALAFLLAAIPAPAAGQSASRAIVLAWDGAVPAFAHEMMREQKLPHLAKLIEGGVFADDVMAVFPSKTAPSFASLITGAPPRVTAISGNRVPRAPRDQFTILESVAGFAAAPLQAETIWAAARRAGKKSIVAHIPTFAGELADGTVRFSGYELIAGRDGIVTKNTAVSAAPASWRNAPPSAALPIEIYFAIGQSKFFGLLIDDAADDQPGYDTLILAADRDGNTTVARLKPAPPGVGGEFFWSPPVAIKTSAGHDTRSYFRLFDLKPDASDFFLYYTRPVRDLPLDDFSDGGASPTVRTFVGNGATLLFQQGAFGRTIPNGGNGAAEARYLETVAFAQHQLTETHRWAMDNLPWDLFFAYTPFPDESEHLWRGHLDRSLSSYRQDLAERLRPLLERVYQQADDLLGLLLSKRPADTLFALISDHGLQGINKRVALNPVLQQAGLLVLDANGRVDLTKTRVIYPAVNNGYLLINSKDRRSGIVARDERAELTSRVRASLLALRDGDRPIVQAVYDAETEGAAMGIGGEVGGDIYVELAPGYDFDPRIAAGPWVSETAPYGNHGANPALPAMRTLMAFNGPGVERGGKLKNARIIDFAPTLAWLLNLPKPRAAAGRVLFEASADDSERKRSQPID
jgi:predicted AlkP superfamily phosphohydrolase/phosphomutase